MEQIHTRFKKGNISGFQYFGEKVTVIAEIAQNNIKTSANGNRYVNIDCDPIIIHKCIQVTNAQVDDHLKQYLHNYIQNRKKRNNIAKGIIDNTLYYPPETRLYQKIGINLLLFKKKFILCQEMGLGKSMQALIACKNILTEPKRILIVCPSYLKMEWKDHINRWYPNEIFFASGIRNKRELIIKDFIEYTAKKTAYLIVNIEMLRDYRILHETYFHVAILDESIRYQDRKSKQTKGMELLNADYIFFLQGILMNKEDPSRIYPLISKIDKGRFTSYWRFVNKYCKVSESFYGYKKIEGANPCRIDEFKSLVKDYMVQHHKRDVAQELPDIIYKTVYVPMNKDHRFEYIKILKTGKIGLKSYPHKMALIEKLRQFLILPKAMKDENGRPYKDWQPTTNVVLELLQDIPEDDQIIIYGFHKAFLCELNSRLNRSGYSTGLITGDTKEYDRFDIICNFKNRDIKILVGNISCLSKGLNLDNAKYAICVEQTWSSEDIDQMNARIHRLTTTESPTVIKLIVKNTISEYIDNILQNDREGVNNMIMIDKILEFSNNDKGEEGEEDD